MCSYVVTYYGKGVGMKGLRVGLSLVLMFLLLSSYAMANASQIEAKTSPPPVSLQPYGFFDPSDKYLLDGSVTIAKNSGKAKISATTYATQVVDSVGFTIYLEKWTGSAWVADGQGVTLSGNNKDAYDNYVTKNVESGYYYRAHTVHWVSHGGDYEHGDRYTDSKLM